MVAADIVATNVLHRHCRGPSLSIREEQMETPMLSEIRQIIAFIYAFPFCSIAFAFPFLPSIAIVIEACFLSRLPI